MKIRTKVLIGVVAGFGLMGFGCSTNHSETQCKKTIDEVEKQSAIANKDLDKAIAEYGTTDGSNIDYIKSQNVKAHRTLLYMIVQNPTCFEPDDVAWAQSWIDSFK